MSQNQSVFIAMAFFGTRLWRQTLKISMDSPSSLSFPKYVGNRRLIYDLRFRGSVARSFEQDHGRGKVEGCYHSTISQLNGALGERPIFLRIWIFGLS